MTEMSVGTVETGTILDQIIASTAESNALKKRLIPIHSLGQMAGRRGKAISLRAALSGSDELSLIAEIKRASPSKGRFPVEFDVLDVALDYVRAGADALSVLTDEPFFQGSIEDLERGCEVAHAWDPARPVLRKDFIIDPYQLVESRAWGADATLLIVAALTDAMLAELMRTAAAIGIETLVEVHDEREMDRALSAGAKTIGINNRDLKTFSVDLAVAERLASMVPDDIVLVGESGIFSGDDARRMRDAGMDAVLVGESLIVAPDRKDAIEAIKIRGTRGARG